ncbi:MAG: radical SAM protein [Candidatus Zixiibacteriota bacterium]
MNEALSNYFRILSSQAMPRFKSSRLETKIVEAFDILESCELCSRRCLVDRTAGERGDCRVGNRMSVSSWFDHYGEEPFFVPSFTIFFHGCTFSCQFCQNWEISQVDEPGDSYVVSEKKLAQVIDAHSYCRNVNFVGGEPTPYLPFILKTLSHVKSNIPVVWNSNFYMSEKSMALLKGVVDVYLSDFKYGNDECALRLSGVTDYSEIVQRNHLLAFEDSEMVIRHLILPNHGECCTKPVLEYIAKHMGNRVVVNLMDQYRPCYKAAHYPDINRRIMAQEFEAGVNLARKLGLNFIT